MKPSQGAALGWFAGLAAILSGALFNAWLNRRRDDHLRKKEFCALANAFAAEHFGITIECKLRADRLRKSPRPTSYESLIGPLPRFTIYEANAERLGLLGAPWASSVVFTYSQLSNLDAQARFSDLIDPSTALDLANGFHEVSKRAAKMHILLSRMAKGEDPMKLSEEFDESMQKVNKQSNK